MVRRTTPCGIPKHPSPDLEVCLTTMACDMAEIWKPCLRDFEGGSVETFALTNNRWERDGRFGPLIRDSLRFCQKKHKLADATDT